MKCVILVAGHGTQLESDIRISGPRNLVGIPKALLPGVKGRLHEQIPAFSLEKRSSSLSRQKDTRLVVVLSESEAYL